MEQLQKYREAFQTLPQGCRSAELHALFTEETSVTCANGELTGCQASESNRLYLRATGEATGMVYTENLEEDPNRLIALALENAAGVEGGQAQPMAVGVQDQKLPSSSVGCPVEDLISWAKDMSRHAMVEDCTVTEKIRRSVVLNSLGTQTEMCTPIYMVSVGVQGKGEDNYKFGVCSRNSLAEIDGASMLRKLAAENALEHEELPYITLPTDSYAAVLSSAVTVNIMNTAWQLFAKRLMDCGRSSLQMGDILGSEKLHITDSAVMPETGFDFTIDMEGVRGPADVHLVQSGVVTNSLRTLADGDSTGCAGRDDLLSGNIHTELLSIPRNIWIHGGEKSPEELIAQMGTGIHVTYSMDEFHSLNIARGTFAIPCGGVYYENGKPVGRLQQMNLYGSFKDLFGALEEVGTDISMNAMCTNDSYCFGGPSMLIRKANFAM